MYPLSGGVRKHLWQVAYPDQLHFVGELASMSTFSPKMVAVVDSFEIFVRSIDSFRIIWLAFLLGIWHSVGTFKMI